MLKSDRRSFGNQLQWVVLLLSAAVVLPTVCLLWFMNQAVKNERLVVRQKLMDVYEGQMELLNRRMDDRWAAITRQLDSVAGANLAPAETFAVLTGASGNGHGEPICSSVIICDANGVLLYPIMDKGGDYPVKPPEEIAEAWNAEFVENDPFKAAQRYSQVAEMHPDSFTGLLALMGKARCRQKAGDINDAILECRRIAYEENRFDIDPASASLIAQTRLQLVALRKETPAGPTRADVEGLIDSATNYTGDQAKGYLPLTSNSRVFFLSKAIEIIKESPWVDALKDKTARGEKLLLTEQIAGPAVDRLKGSVLPEARSKDNTRNLVTALRTILELIEKSDWYERLKVDTSQAKEVLAAAQNLGTVFGASPGAEPVESQPQDRLRRIQPAGDLFGLYHSASGRIFLLLRTTEQVSSDFDVLKGELSKLGLSYRITDDKSSYVTGLQNPSDKPLITVPMGTYFPDWRISLYADQTNIFERAANRRIALYLWTGILVIMLILLAGAFAAQTVRRQIRLNKMKNDFIATVSHELKTPLASMRVLVDTLLEGNVKDENQTEEYLRLTAKENERLSRMIDNFLTFSRMERNKKVFSIVDSKPASIAGDAAEAVKTKFTANNCQLAVDIANNLPCTQADHDAMVTVLVNLLDNACKYTGDEKQITLKVFAENNNICFAVSDNGIGLARRHIRKIFDSFYQVDTSLARKVEGCGLGLSIVKFIVDAHKGKVAVESKPGKGSTFTVRLPIERDG